MKEFELTPPTDAPKWNAVHFSAAHDHWSTPAELYASLDKEFRFTLDPCPLKGTDGLARSWKEQRVYCNPPYSKIGPWLEKAAEADLAVFLLPSRTDTDWFHRYAPRAEVRFLRGRLKFGTAQMNAPFPSVILIFRKGDV